jgi:hypothetical protein
MSRRLTQQQPPGCREPDHSGERLYWLVMKEFENVRPASPIPSVVGRGHSHAHGLPGGWGRLPTAQRDQPGWLATQAGSRTIDRHGQHRHNRPAHSRRMGRSRAACGVKRPAQRFSFWELRFVCGPVGAIRAGCLGGGGSPTNPAGWKPAPRSAAKMRTAASVRLQVARELRILKVDGE